MDDWSLDHEYDDVLVHHYVFPTSGRQPLPNSTPVYNKFAGEMPVGGSWEGGSTPVRLRNIKAGRPAIAHRLHIGEVVRYIGNTCIHNLEGRKTNTEGSSLRISGAHRVGGNYNAPGCMGNPPLPNHVRIVYIDVREVRWCSVGSVAFHWNWSKMERPYVVYTEGSVGIGGGDPVPAWLVSSCVYMGF